MGVREKVTEGTETVKLRVLKYSNARFSILRGIRPETICLVKNNVFVNE